MIYTIVGDNFRIWVADRIQERNEKLQVEKDLLIQMDPEVAKVFMASSDISL